MNRFGPGIRFFVVSIKSLEIGNVARAMSTGKAALLIGDISHSRKEWKDISSLAKLMVFTSYLRLSQTDF